jgi:hypothetical protein
MSDQISFLYFLTYLVGFNNCVDFLKKNNNNNNCVDCAVRERTLTCSPFGSEKKNAFMTKLSVMPFLAKNKLDHKDFFLSIFFVCRIYPILSPPLY